jgi:hypothetical protein
VSEAPQQAKNWRRLALAYLAAGEKDAYLQSCRQMLRRFSPRARLNLPLLMLSSVGSGPLAVAAVAAARLDPHDPPVEERLQVVRACAMQQSNNADPSWLLLLFDNPEADSLEWGAALCRAGHYDAAAATLQESRGTGMLYAALAEVGRGRTNEAKQAVQRAAHWLDSPSADAPFTPNAARRTWEECLEWRVLRSEVEARLGEGDLNR